MLGLDVFLQYFPYCMVPGDDAIPEHRAMVLLVQNTSRAERMGAHGLTVKGARTGATYLLQAVHPTHPVNVTMEYDGKRVCGFCVYSDGYRERPMADEVLTLALYIKYAEELFLGTAVPHVTEEAMPTYRALLDGAGIKNWVTHPEAMYLQAAQAFLYIQPQEIIFQR